MRRSFFASALTAGLIVGALDITGAFISANIQSDKSPEWVLQSVASGAFGKEAFSGGMTMALYGLLFHFIIAISFTFLFFFIVMIAPSLVKIPLLTGLLYGIFVWAAMRYLILPYFSRITPRPFDLKAQSIQAGILIVCIGIPLAFLARRYVRTKA